MASKVNPNQSLDCIGLYCPEPVFQTRMELDKLNQGDVLEVLADDPAAEEDIKRLVKRLGHELISFTRQGKTIRFLIRKC